MRKIVSLILVALLSFVVWATITSTAENIKISADVRDFVNKATFVEEKSTTRIKYYEVKSNTPLDLPSYQTRGSMTYPGSPGDIICAKTAAVEIPILYEGITFYVGGHAALCGFPYESDEITFNTGSTLEITGFGSDITANIKKSYTFFNGYYDEFMVYRVDTSLENRFQAFINSLSYYGQSYNYGFIFNQKTKKYCSNLVDMAYRDVDVILNQDGLATTVLDIMASPRVYLVYYSKLDDNGIRYNYALV